MRKQIKIEDVFKALKGSNGSSLQGKERSIILEKLLKRAYTIRDFEIKLFWQRALYFWGFISVSFAAYLIVSDVTKFSASSHMKLLIACIGLILSFSWYLVNRASTHWKENWETIIDLIENDLGQPLYRLNIENPENDNSIIDRKHFRISIISTIVCLSICVVWFLLIISALSNFTLCLFCDYKTLGVLALTIFAIMFLYFETQINYIKGVSTDRVLYKRGSEVKLKE